jgi:hypothetical protein
MDRLLQRRNRRTKKSHVTIQFPQIFFLFKSFFLDYLFEKKLILKKKGAPSEIWTRGLCGFRSLSRALPLQLSQKTVQSPANTGTLCSILIRLPYQTGSLFRQFSGQAELWELCNFFMC